nr:hypothetical protein [Tanacetum cinerariifolium]
PIPSECEVALEDKRECTVPIFENFPDCDNRSDILFDSNNDDLSSDDESFEDIEYVDALVPDPVIASVEENIDHQEQEEINFEDISQIQDVVLREKLFSFTRLISNIESLNANSTPDCVFDSFESDNSLLDNFYPNLKLFAIIRKRREVDRLINLVENDIPDNSSNDPLIEEVNLFRSDDSIPQGIENFADDPEGDIRFLEELLIDNSILYHESFDSSFEDNPSISRPPSEPPDDNFDLEPDVISAVMEDIDEPDEHFNPGGEIFVSTNNEDDYPPKIEAFLCRILSWFPKPSPSFHNREEQEMIELDRSLDACR